MAKNEKSAGAVVYYVDTEPRFLLLRNTLKTTYWEFPKGKIEENENLIETAKREVQEETGLKNLEVIKGFNYHQEWFFKFEGQIIHKNAIYVLIKVPAKDAGKVKINMEHQAFAWYSYKQAMDVMKIKNNKEMLQAAYDFIIDYEKQKRLF